jgi:hypothetical protein
MTRNKKMGRSTRAGATARKKHVNVNAGKHGISSKEFRKNLEVIANAYPVAQAYVGVSGPGKPILRVALPQRPRHLNFAAIESALRNEFLILDLSSADGVESLSFMLDFENVSNYHPRPPKTDPPS